MKLKKRNNDAGSGTRRTRRPFDRLKAERSAYVFISKLLAQPASYQEKVVRALTPSFASTLDTTTESGRSLQVVAGALAAAREQLEGRHTVSEMLNSAAESLVRSVIVTA